jgi:hypothetical protein
MEFEESEAVMPFELNGRAIQLILKSVSFHLEKWPGGDPQEQQELMDMKLLFTAANLEFQFRSE